MNRIFIKSVLGGLMIAIGYVVYIEVTHILGAFMFSIGLISIFQLGLCLYTGVISYTDKVAEIPFVVTVLVGNIVGCCLMFLFPYSESVEIVKEKLNDSHLQILLSSMLCNVLIFVAVEANKHKNNILVIMSVATFILAGFNHSIANVCMVISSRLFNFDTLALIVISIIGNTIGGIVTRKLVRYANSKDRVQLCG